ncbi:MAG: sigma-70 family RNA polymerase sigma factor [Phycisphaerales bacterium]|nr:sigma-70 family RNA polymerase sigma factor [Phycisphaerales bacterium]
MPEQSPSEVTQILGELCDGDSSAADRLLPVVYDELRMLARSFLRRERADHTLQPTALVHEAYLKLIDQASTDWKGKQHFMAIAAQAIRRILVDHARAHRAAKRGGGDWRRITLQGVPNLTQHDDLDFERLDAVLSELAQLNERQAKVVELRFFGGMSVEETAELLDVSERTVKGDWRFARAWLQNQLTNPETT